MFYALAASVWTVWLWMTGLKVVPAAQAGVFTAMLPVSAALVGVLVLGEPLGRVQALAFALALAGVLLATAAAPRLTPAGALLAAKIRVAGAMLIALSPAVREQRRALRFPLCAAARMRRTRQRRAPGRLQSDAHACDAAPEGKQACSRG